MPAPGAHGQAEQELPPHVAGNGARDARGVVVVGRAVPGRHDGPHDGTDARPVEQHVHGDHEDEDQAEARPDDRLQQIRAERDDLPGPAHDAVLQRLQRRPALFLELDVDAAVVERLLQIGQALVGGVDDRGDVVAERVDLVGDRVGQEQAGDDQHEEEAGVDDEDRQPPRHAPTLHELHQRVEDQGDDRRDREDQQHGPAARASA
jgi:hypothetical protein